jgi:hypothetical protein
MELHQDELTLVPKLTGSSTAGDLWSSAAEGRV